MNETKQHILKTSLLLFLQRSYRDVTMKDIVEKTGLSKGAFYHYFSSKEELFKEIAGYFFSYGSIDYSSLTYDSFYDFYHGYAKLIGDAFQQLFEFVGVKRNDESIINFFMILFEAVNRFPEFLEIEQKLHEKDIEVWGKIIRTAREKGEIKSSSSDEQIAEIFTFCQDGLVLRLMSSNRINYFREELVKTFDSLYEGLKA